MGPSSRKSVGTLVPPSDQATWCELKKRHLNVQKMGTVTRKSVPTVLLDTKLNVGRKTQHVTRRCHTREKCVPMRPGLLTLLSSTSHIIWFSFFRHCFSFHVHYSNKRLKTDS